VHDCSFAGTRTDLGNLFYGKPESDSEDFVKCYRNSVLVLVRGELLQAGAT